MLGKNYREKYYAALVSCLDAVAEAHAAEGNADGGFSESMHAVVAIGAYRDMEDEILAELGRDDGLRVILDEKRRVLPHEQRLGFAFFAADVQRLETRFLICRLYASELDLPILATDTVEELQITLSDANGKPLRFKRITQIRHEGNIYLECELLEDMLPPYNLCYYLVTQTAGGFFLTLIEDEELRNTLWYKIDSLIK